MQKILLYAPTWRNYETEKFEKIDVDGLLKACGERFGGKWVFVFRGHNLSKESSHVAKESCCIDATNYYDMQKLMIAAEVLVSDYSSCIWDFSLMFKPCFLYVPDLRSMIRLLHFTRQFIVGDLAFVSQMENWLRQLGGLIGNRTPIA